MALWNRTKEPDRTGVVSDVKELLRHYDLVEVQDDYIVVAERPKQLAQQNKTITELGSAGSQYYRMGSSEYNPKWMGLTGLRQVDEMRRGDGQVKAILRLVKTPVLAGSWYMEPASEKKRDQKIAEFVWNNLTKWMSVSFPQFLMESLASLDFGWYCFEKVYTFRDDKVIWKKFAPRHPMDAGDWEFDSNGGPNGIWYPKYGGGDEEIFIPINRLLVFTNDKEGGNWEGTSILRPAYKHWFYKDNLYKIDAIQKERHGVGVPIIKLPPNWADGDKRIAETLGSNLRSNEKAHVVLPPGWDILMLKLEGQPVNIMDSIEHHDKLMARSVLGHFMNRDTSTEDTATQEMFLKAIRYIADQVRDVINKYAIPELVGYNWNVDEFPELRVRRIGETVDWRTISFALRNFVGANIIQPDEALEKHIRSEMDLPRKDKETVREVATPQMPKSAQAKAPRQAPTQAPSSGKANAGTDGSGG